jgi:hypothetical protein
MGLKYGKMPRRTRRYVPQRAVPRTLRVQIGPCADLEHLSLELQKMVARLQDGGVHGTGACSVYVELRDASGGLMALRDDNGGPVEVLDV